VKIIFPNRTATVFYLEDLTLLTAVFQIISAAKLYSCW